MSGDSHDRMVRRTRFDSYPEIAIFLSLAFGYYFGSFTYKGLGLGAVTATLIAAVIIGQLGITISRPLKPFFFLMFLFAIGYGGRAAIRARHRARMACRRRFSRRSSACSACSSPISSPRSPATTSAPPPASMPARRRSRPRWASPPTRSTASGCRPSRPRRMLDAMPVAYAVTYIFGTVGSAIILALLGPALLGIDLEAACKRYEEKHGGTKEVGGAGTAWHQFELRAYPRRGRTAASSARPLRRPKRWCPSSASSSSASAATARSSKRPPTP